MTILILAPHADDGEFGCGGSIAKYVEMGADVCYAAFTLDGGPPMDGMPHRSMETELTGATQKLGIKSEFIPRLSVIDIMVNLGEKWVECLNKQEGKGE